MRPSMEEIISVATTYNERTNQLTNPALDPVAKIPELKVCAVRVEKQRAKTPA